MLRRIFLVDSDPQAAVKLARSLVDHHYSVSVVSSFEEVCVLAASQRPDLLITNVRLGRFNGLHLAARFRADYPGLPLIVLGEDEEIALAADAMQLQARFVPKSIPCDTLIRYIDDLISGRCPRDLVSTRRWPRHYCNFPAQMAGATGHVTDAGYGGFRLRCDREPAAGVATEVSLAIGMSVTGICRWSARADDQTWNCGFEIDTSATDVRTWRRLVDSLLP